METPEPSPVSTAKNGVEIMGEWIDISQPLNNKVPVWPGDTPFSYTVNWSKNESGSVNVGQLIMSTHTGTHIDAPYHFDDNGKRVAELEVDVFIGRTRVIYLPNKNTIGKNELFNFDLEGVTRLLIRTDVWLNYREFPESIPCIEPNIAKYLSEIGVRLFGLDLPSVDPLDSKELSTHHELAKYGVHILEGLVLNGISPGDYELIALPLSLSEADGSPVRAVIKKYK